MSDAESPSTPSVPDGEVKNPLQERFPDLRPMKSAPNLFRINGCGAAIMGSRDYDPETGTYVATQFFTLLFVPIVAMAAYRVANADEQSWYFLGRVPLSRLARGWNWALILGLLITAGSIGWMIYANSPDYRAAQQLAEADRKAEAGKLAEAAVLYQELAMGGSAKHQVAAERLSGLLDRVEEQPTSDAAAIYVQAVRVFQHRKPAALQDVFQRGLKFADRHGAVHVRESMAVLNALDPIAGEPRAKAAEQRGQLAARRETLLEPFVKANPNDIESASELALLYEAKNRWDDCEKILAPLEAKLGITEAARILGQIYARQGKNEPAYALLSPYAEGRLKTLHAAEQAYHDAVKALEDLVIRELQNKNAENFNFTRYQSAKEAEQKQMVNEYLTTRLKESPSVELARAALMKEAQVVPVAFDLGIVLLRRAQALAEPMRRFELEKAEKLFLAVQGVAGHSDEYRLSLGQVYFWMDRAGDGRKLFDEILAVRQRDYDSLLQVGAVLREVGALADARKLVEEAYEKEKAADKKKAAAHMRSVTFIDLDDSIVWLERSDLNMPDVKASLSSAKGYRAQREGKNAEAADLFREAIEIYARQPETTTVLNNQALAWLALHHCNGERDALDRAAELLEKALALKGNDSILLSNVAHTLAVVAIQDLLANKIDRETLRYLNGRDQFAYLYADAAARETLREQVRKHPIFAKARGCYDRQLLLAPRNREPYLALYSMHALTNDQTALKALFERTAEADFDLTDHLRRQMEAHQGVRDEQTRKELQVQMERFEPLLTALRSNKDKSALTFAAAVGHWQGLRERWAALGQPVNADDLVTLTEEAHAAAPSRHTLRNRIAALCFRAAIDLARAEPDFEKLASRCRRSLDAVELIAVALEREGKLRDACVKNKDVAAAVELGVDLMGRFPEDMEGWLWALLRHTRPEAASKLAERFAKQKDYHLAEARAITRLGPADGSAIYRAVWTYQLAGQDEEAKKILKAGAAHEVPLPEEP